MPIKVLLNFNGEGAFSALQERFSTVITELCQTVLANAQANVGGQYPEVQASLKMNLMSLAQQGFIDGQISSDHWQAWIAEWGSGSQMDTSNPDLAGYMASELWNPARTGKTIVGRPEGEYLGLDGQMHYSSGAMEGKYLEHMYDPDTPLHFMRNALLSNKNLILDQLNGVIEQFSFGDFFT